MRGIQHAFVVAGFIDGGARTSPGPRAGSGALRSVRGLWARFRGRRWCGHRNPARPRV